MKSEPQNSMYVVRAPKLLGVSAQRPIRVGTLFEDLLNKSHRIKTLSSLRLRAIIGKGRPLPCRNRFHPFLYPTCLHKTLDKNT